MALYLALDSGGRRGGWGWRSAWLESRRVQAPTCSPTLAAGGDDDEAKVVVTAEAAEGRAEGCGRDDETESEIASSVDSVCV